VTATVRAGNGVTLSWTDNSTSETGFRVERSLYPDRHFTQLAVLKANATTYTDKDLAGNAVYYYRVRSYNNRYVSPYSAVAGAVLSSNVVLMSNATVTACDALFTDSGGAGNYAEETYTVITLSPAIPGTKVQLNFVRVQSEKGRQTLRFVKQ
jgi:hypothetical protein